MRILFALTAFAIACGGSTAKKESSIVQEGDVPQQCCCKTLPSTAEKEIVPQYAMSGRMECSSQHGDCVDDVQCNAAGGDQPASGGDGVPAPPVLEPSTNAGGI